MRPANAIETMEPCRDCKGTGRSGGWPSTCPTCDGGRRHWYVPERDDDLPAHTLAERQWQDDRRVMHERDAERRWIDTDREWP